LYGQSYLRGRNILAAAPQARHDKNYQLGMTRLDVCLTDTGAPAWLQRWLKPLSRAGGISVKQLSRAGRRLRSGVRLPSLLKPEHSPRLLPFLTTEHHLFSIRFFALTWHERGDDLSMIGHTDLPNWGALFTGALVALAVIIYCQSFFWRTHKKSSPKKGVSTPKRFVTLRIEEIPIDTSSAALTDNLRSLVNQHLDLKEDRITIDQPSPIQRNQKIACATATFHTRVPADELIRKLHQAEARPSYRFDVKFHGITPLYEAQGGADVE
jgi:hypothetical protein